MVRGMGQFEEKAFVPDSVEGLAYIHQDSACRLVLVSGVRQKRSNAYKLQCCSLLWMKLSNSREIRATRRHSNTYEMTVCNRMVTVKWNRMIAVCKHSRLAGFWCHTDIGSFHRQGKYCSRRQELNTSRTSSTPEAGRYYEAAAPILSGTGA